MGYEQGERKHSLLDGLMRRLRLLRRKVSPEEKTREPTMSEQIDGIMKERSAAFVIVDSEQQPQVAASLIMYQGYTQLAAEGLSAHNPIEINAFTESVTTGSRKVVITGYSEGVDPHTLKKIRAIEQQLSRGTNNQHKLVVLLEHALTPGTFSFEEDPFINSAFGYLAYYFENGTIREGYIYGESVYYSSVITKLDNAKYNHIFATFLTTFASWPKF